jgi:Flp pilus assembly protein TadG
MKTNPVFANSSSDPKRRDERGMTIVMVALSILLLMAMAALAIDVGILYTARTSAQHAADAAALAGAYSFMDATASQPSSAQNAAIAVAARNSVMGQAVTLTTDDVKVEQALHRVTVTVNRNVGANPINTFFAGALGISQMGTAAKAVAEGATKGTETRCLKPVFLPNSIMGNPSLSPDDQCSAGQYLFNQDGTLSAFGQSKLGTSAIIRPASPSSALGPGQFYSLDFGNSNIGHGATVYKCALGQCLNTCGVSAQIKCGGDAPLDAKTGNMVGPTTTGINELIGSPQDRWKGIDQYYMGDTSTLSDTSRSLAVAPVWNNCTNIGGTTIGQGTQQNVPVIGFVQIFVDSVVQTGSNKGDTTAHIVREISCDAAAAGAGGSNTGPYAIPIRLVQVPQ